MKYSQLLEAKASWHRKRKQQLITSGPHLWFWIVECKILVDRADFDLGFIIASRVTSNTYMSSVTMKKHWLEWECDIRSSTIITWEWNDIGLPSSKFQLDRWVFTWSIVLGPPKQTFFNTTLRHLIQMYHYFKATSVFPEMNSLSMRIFLQGLEETRMFWERLCYP